MAAPQATGHHRHRHSPERRGLLIASCITAAIMIVEFAGGFWANSLALVSDAGHMLTDLLALLLSLFAVVIAGRPATSRKTYGFYRLEILAALFNGLLLVGLSVVVLWNAVHRLRQPGDVHEMRMLVVAVVGLAANLASVFVLSGSLRSLNVRGAFLHVVSDTLSSAAVIAAAVVIRVTGWTLVDPILSLAIASVILYGAYSLVREALDVLLEATPLGVELAQVREAIRGLADVVEVHDLHVWSITSGMPVLSGHVVVREQALPRAGEILRAVGELLRERFNIEHATIQIEPEGWEETGVVH